MSLVLDGVSKTVGAETHIDDVSLTCEAGGFNILLGLTEAGKTTLMRLMAGLERPTSGTITAQGKDVTRVPVRRRNVAMVYQQFVNYPSFTVYENIASPLRRAGFAGDEIDRRVRREAERLKISELLDRRPAALSGGQQQRTAMARALVRDADLVLLDEPLANLDYKLREELRIEMRNLFSERGTVVVYATTDPAEAMVLGGRIAVLHEGRLLQTGPTPQVYRQPANESVARVFGDPPMNLIDAHIDNGVVDIGEVAHFPAPIHLADLPPGDYRLGVRPAHLDITSGPGVDLQGRVEVAEIAGSTTFIHIQMGEVEWVVEADGVQALEPGRELAIRVAPERLFAFAADGRLAAAPDIGGH